MPDLILIHLKEEEGLGYSTWPKMSSLERHLLGLVSVLLFKAKDGLRKVCGTHTFTCRTGTPAVVGNLWQTMHALQGTMFLYVEGVWSRPAP